MVGGGGGVGGLLFSPIDRYFPPFPLPILLYINEMIPKYSKHK